MLSQKPLAHTRHSHVQGGQGSPVVGNEDRCQCGSRLFKLPWRHAFEGQVTVFTCYVLCEVYVCIVRWYGSAVV